MNRTLFEQVLQEPPHKLIRASAGTGKTFALTSRYLHLLASDIPPHHILATTFTRKAAGEIQQRVLSRLAEAVDSEPKARELSRQIGRPELRAGDYESMLERLIATLDQWRIGTLDSFFVGLAGAFWLELSLPAGWTIGEPVALADLRTEAIGRLLQESSAEDLALLLRLMNRGAAGVPVYEQLDRAVRQMHALWLEAPQIEAWDWMGRPVLLSDRQIQAAR
ncbi:MAG: UvrD-helicase domain-containing protein, partial [Phycisphaeraceae bacterium]|nr:UvrD-helicase domain-containing protein [Phycisphaeraceae bacterium]